MAIKRPTKIAISPKTKPAKPKEVSVNDVVGALLDLFKKLQIDASNLASRVESADHKRIAPHRLYSHAAAIGELLSVWHQDPRYLDKSGNPLPLRTRGSGRSFSNLAKAVPTMSAPALLRELERAGAVTIDDNRHVHVRMRSLSVYEDKRLAIQHTLTSLFGFIGTLRHNLDSDPSNSDQLFHRVAWNGDFEYRLVPTLKIKIKRQGQTFLEAFDNWMMRQNTIRSGKRKPRGKRVQIILGVYLAVGEK
ncbi:MAG: DUF6502 family protein [Methylocella sp.]